VSRRDNCRDRAGEGIDPLSIGKKLAVLVQLNRHCK
jgi:hypothetical protein